MIHLHKDLYLTADASQFILFHKSVAKKGKNKGKEVITKQTYHPTINLLMQQLFHESIFSELKKDDQKNLKFMVKRFKKLTKVLKEVSDKIGNTRNLYAKSISKEEQPLEDDEILEDDDEILEDDDEILEDD